MQPGKLNSVLSSSNKQKTIPARIVDVLGSKCSVRLSSNGQKLTGLSFVGVIPSIGDLVLVDYRNQSTPVVLTSASETVEVVSNITATPVTSSSPQEPDPKEYIEFPPVDNKFYVAKDNGWVEMPTGSIEMPESDGKLYGVRNGSWEEIVIPMRIGEVLTGEINGINREFFTTHPFIADSLEISMNGLIQNPGVDYAFAASLGKIVFTEAPLSNGFTDFLFARYFYVA